MSGNIDIREFSINDYDATVAYQGRGLGKRLVDECLEGLRRAGLKRVIIMVADDNPRGREFWKACGWVEITGTIEMGIDL